MPGLPFFSVEAKNENRGVPTVSWLRDVTVEVYNHRVTLPKGTLGTVQVGSFHVLKSEATPPTKLCNQHE